MTLREELKAVIGKRRRFLLFRIADVDTDTARKLCVVKKGTYNSWLQDSTFVALYRRRDEFAQDYKKEAIKLLRRDNQLAAVLLEEKILTKMKLEVDTGVYNLVKTNLAKEVYSKLINDLDATPLVNTLTWEQRLQQLIISGNTPEQLPEGTPIPIEAHSTVVIEDVPEVEEE